MLENIKSLLGIANDDVDRDNVIKLLISLATKRLTRLIAGIEPPEELDYIIIDVVVSRYNRIGSEGLSSHSVEGESQTFTDDDFKKFNKDIEDFVKSSKTGQIGRVSFI